MRRIALLLILLSVNACGVGTLAQADFCAVYRPVTPTKSEWAGLSELTASQIDANNAVHDQRCR